MGPVYRLLIYSRYRDQDKGWTTQESRLDFWKGREIFFILLSIKIGPGVYSASYLAGNRECFPWGKVASVKLTTYRHPESRLRMYGAIGLTSLPYMLSWQAQAQIYSTFQQTHVFKLCHKINNALHNGQLEIQTLRLTVEHVFIFTTNFNWRVTKLFTSHNWVRFPL